MRRGEKGLTVVLAAALLWVILMSVLSLFGNGWFYHVEQPVPVVNVDEEAGTATLFYRRYARWPMHAMCANELHCVQVHEFGEQACPLEPGWGEFEFELPLLDCATEGGGEGCLYRGTVVYSPIGVLGPRLTYYWESEPFSIEAIE